MMDARARVNALGDDPAPDAITRLIADLVHEVERLQRLAKRGHGREFVDSNGRFDVV